jgi:hypothetical protein
MTATKIPRNSLARKHPESLEKSDGAHRLRRIADQIFDFCSFLELVVARILIAALFVVGFVTVVWMIIRHS